MNTIGVIIARFQSPYIHEGHKSLVNSVKQKHNKTVIVLGVSPVLGSRRNPLDFPTRERMIKKEYPDIVVLPLPDHPSNSKWSQNLDSTLANTFPGSGFTLYGSRDSFISFYSGNNQTCALPENGHHNSTEIRQHFGDKVMDKEEFRSGVIYAYSNTYLKVHPTVDIAIFRNNKTELLMGRKEVDNKWQLPGGFADPTDNNYETTAQRELKEECGAIETGPMNYEGSYRVDDWRYKQEADKIITCLFSAEFVYGIPTAGDDLAEVSWFSLKEISDMMESDKVAEAHFPQLNALLKKYNLK